MRIWRIRDRRSFERLRRDGVRRRSGPVTVTVVPAASATPPRVAYAVGRRVGPAAVRNKVRRRLRAIVADTGAAPGDYLISAGPEAAALPYEVLQRHVVAALSAATEAAR